MEGSVKLQNSPCRKSNSRLIGPPPDFGTLFEWPMSFQNVKNGNDEKTEKYNEKNPVAPPCHKARGVGGGWGWGCIFLTAMLVFPTVSAQPAGWLAGCLAGWPAPTIFQEFPVPPHFALRTLHYSDVRETKIPEDSGQNVKALHLINGILCLNGVKSVGASTVSGPKMQKIQKCGFRPPEQIVPPTGSGSRAGGTIYSGG